MIDTLMNLADEYFPEPEPKVLQIKSKKNYKHQKGKGKIVIKTITPPKVEKPQPRSFGEAYRIVVARGVDWAVNRFLLRKDPNLLD